MLPRHVFDDVVDHEVATHDTARANTRVQDVFDSGEVLDAGDPGQVVEKVLDAVAQLELGAASKTLLDGWVSPEGRERLAHLGVDVLTLIEKHGVSYVLVALGELKPPLLRRLNEGSHAVDHVAMDNPAELAQLATRVS